MHRINHFKQGQYSINIYIVNSGAKFEMKDDILCQFVLMSLASENYFH